MNQFTFEASQKRLFIGMIGLGVLCLALTYFTDEQPGHIRFWTNMLHNSVLFLGIGFVSLFKITAGITAYGGWYVLFKRIWESFSLFMIPGLIMMLIIIAGIWGHMHHIYHWTDTTLVDPANPEFDSILAGKAAFLNRNWFTFGTLIFVGVWIFFALKLRSLSIQEDEVGNDDNFNHHRRIRVWAAAFLPIAAFSSAATIWLWIMSIDAHWYSTMFAWYTTASWFVSALALTILLLIYLKSKGYYQQVTAEHLHDLGKFLFAFSIFWTYLWFSQYMLIWYANVGEETIYFKERIDNYPVLFYGNLIMNFVLPFFILLRNDTKRKVGTMILVPILVFFGHWWDFFNMIKPGSLQTALHAAGGHGAGHEGAEHATGAVEHATTFAMGFTIPGLLEIGTLVGFLGCFFYFVFSRLAQASLVPENDPYFEESVHHHV